MQVMKVMTQASCLSKSQHNYRDGIFLKGYQLQVMRTYTGDGDGSQGERIAEDVTHLDAPSPMRSRVIHLLERRGVQRPVRGHKELKRFDLWIDEVGTST
jgi:hypothetical protein